MSGDGNGLLIVVILDPSKCVGFASETLPARGRGNWAIACGPCVRHSLDNPHPAAAALRLDCLYSGFTGEPAWILRTPKRATSLSGLGLVWRERGEEQPIFISYA